MRLNRVDGKSAGASAQLKYQRLLSRWLWEQRHALLYFACLPIVAAVLVVWMDAGTLLAFILGILAGVGVFGLLVIPVVAPSDIINWKVGGEGEQSTAAQLEKVQRYGWRTVHDRALGRGNVDHILVGPGGVFAIDSKKLSKEVEVVNGTVRTGGFAQDRMSKNARGLAAEINKVIKVGTPHNVWVGAVLVFWGDFPQNHVKGDRITYVSGETLTAWLYSLERILTPQQVDSIVAAIEAMPDGILLEAEQR